MKCHGLFLGKNRKSTINLSSAKLAQREVKIINGRQAIQNSDTFPMVVLKMIKILFNIINDDDQQPNKLYAGLWQPFLPIFAFNRFKFNTLTAGIWKFEATEVLFFQTNMVWYFMQTVRRQFAWNFKNYFLVKIWKISPIYCILNLSRES